MKRECCDGLCEQGRHCPARMPAEAATELGAEDTPYRSGDFFVAVICIVATLIVLWSWK